MTGTFNSVCTCYSLVSHGSAFCRTVAEAFWLLMGLSCWPLSRAHAHSLSLSRPSHTHGNVRRHTNTRTHALKLAHPDPGGNYRPLYYYIRRTLGGAVAAAAAAAAVAAVAGEEKDNNCYAAAAQNRSYCVSRVAHINFRFPSFTTFFRGREKRSHTVYCIITPYTLRSRTVHTHTPVHV